MGHKQSKNKQTAVTPIVAAPQPDKREQQQRAPTATSTDAAAAPAATGGKVKRKRKDKSGVKKSRSEHKAVAKPPVDSGVSCAVCACALTGPISEAAEIGRVCRSQRGAAVSHGCGL